MIAESPLVSIVTPSFNQAPFLEYTLRSVFDQDYRNIEYVVIDGGSTDGSVEIIERYSKKLAFWTSGRDGGQSAAVNAGWRRAHGEIWAFVNSDDMLAPGAINRIVETFKKNPGIGIVYGDCMEIDEHNKQTGFWRSRQTTLADSISRGQAFAQPAAFFNSELVKKVGMINDNLQLSFDYDLILKLMKSAPIHYIPEVLALARIHGSTKTNTLVEKHWRETLRVQWTHGRLYMFPYIMKYLRYRIFHALPISWQLAFRRVRKSNVDTLILKQQS